MNPNADTTTDGRTNGPGIVKKSGSAYTNESLRSQNSSTYEPRSDTDQHNEQHQANADLGAVSEQWKHAASCLFLGAIIFLLGGIVYFAFALTLGRIFLYAIGILTVMYGAMRFGFAYFIYKDAKLLGFHTKNRRRKGLIGPSEGWVPHPKLWAFFVFCMPPFAELGPAVMYYLRRHYRTGIP